MFQGSFSYNKGPCWIQEDETLVEQKYAIVELKRINALKVDDDRVAQELAQQIKREAYFGRTKKRYLGVLTQQKHIASTSVYIREKGKGGINWWRYQQVILIPLLIPFAKECQVNRPNTLVEEDKAASHASQYQPEIFILHEVIRLLQPSNSLNLNAIELTWNWIKRKTTKKGCTTSKKQMKADQLTCQDEMPQSKIQDQIKRIKRHIDEVILLEGGNEYNERRCIGQLKTRVY